MPDLAPAADALKCDLAAEVLRSSGQLRLRVSGASMLPALWPGDILTVHRHDPTQLRPGDLVLAARNGGLAVHHLLAIHGPLVTTHVWRGSPALEEVRSIRPRDLPACCGCAHLAGCTRCPGLAYMEGDLRGPSSLDCEKSYARTGIPTPF